MNVSVGGRVQVKNCQYLNISVGGWVRGLVNGTGREMAVKDRWLKFISVDGLDLKRSVFMKKSSRKT